MDATIVAFLVTIASGGVALFMTIALAAWLRKRREREAARRAVKEWWAQHRAHASAQFTQLADERDRLRDRWLELDQERFEAERKAKDAGA